MKKIITVLSLVMLIFVLSLSASSKENKVVIDNVVYELKEDLQDNKYGEHYVVTDFFEDEALAETTTKITILDEIEGIKVLGIVINDVDFEGDGYYRENANTYPAVKEVVIPDTIKYIGSFAFSCFPSVEAVALPDGLETMGIGAFAYMESLKNITIPKDVTYINNRAFYACGSLTKVVFKGDVTRIGSCAFSNCTKLSSVDFPDSLEVIGEDAFYGTGLKKIVLPAGVNTSHSFSECKSLENVVYMSAKPVETIEIDDFSNCIKLKNIYVRAIATKSIRLGSSNSLFGDRGLKNIYFEGSKALWNKLTLQKDRTALSDKDVYTGYYYKHQHSFTIDGVPTCKKGGTYNYKCVCGDSFKVTLPKNPNNHSFGAWKVTKEATCAVTGLRKRTCKTCGYVEQAKIRKEHLGKPKSLMFENSKANELTLVWDEVEKATGYIVYSQKVATDKNGKKYDKYTEIAKVTDGTKYVVKNLKPGKLYGFGVAAYNVDKNGKTAVSPITYNATWTSTLPPTNLKVVSNSVGVIEISLDDCGENAQYQIWYGTNKELVELRRAVDDQAKLTIVTKNMKTIQNLISGETYYVRVTTEGEGKKLQHSETVSVVVK